MPSMIGGAPFLTAVSTMCAQCAEAITGSRCAIPVAWRVSGQTGTCQSQPIAKCWEVPVEGCNRLS